MWDKVRSYWGLEEHVGNLMRTQRKLHKKEHFKNKRKQTSPPSPQRKKKHGPLGACYLTSLATRIFFAYLSSLSFLA